VLFRSADQLARVLPRPVRGPHRRPVLVSPPDDLKKVLPGPLGQLIHPHVVPDQQVGLEIPGEHLLVPAEGLVLQEVPNGIEDRAVPARVPPLDGLIPDGLHPMAVARARRAEQQQVATFPTEPAGRQVKALLPPDRRIAREVEVLQGLGLPEVGRPAASGPQAIPSDATLALAQRLNELPACTPQFHRFPKGQDVERHRS